MTSAKIAEFYIASTVKDGGAVLFGIDGEGKLSVRGKVPMPSPGWTEITDGRICAAVTDPEVGEAYAEYSILSGERLFGPVPAEGVSLCHFSKDGDEVWGANYHTGSILHIKGDRTDLRVHEVPRDGELGCDRGRQERPHCHQCLLSPDRRFVLVSDLGLDTIFVYDRDLMLISKAKVPDGHGPRHGIFSHDGKKLYSLAEMASSLTVFDWDGENGILTPVETISFRPELEGTPGFDGLTDAASIVLSPDGRHLWCSNRGTANTIAHLTVSEDGRHVTVVSQTPSGGNHPRAMGLVADGKFLAVCNTFADNLTVFRVLLDGELEAVSSASVPRPSCVNAV